MITSKGCHCPFDTKFALQQSGALAVCANPTEECADKRDRLINQTAAWTRIARTAESARDGILRFSQLTPGDFLHVASIRPSTDTVQYDRELLIQIGQIHQTTLEGTVMFDTYLQSDDMERRHFAHTAGGTMMIYGAYQKEGDASTDWTNRSIPGELHVGRFVEYGHPGETVTYGLYVHEVTVLDEDNSVHMPLFGADPHTPRPAPLLQ